MPTLFTGIFEGLGNTISHLTAKLSTPQTFGLFEEVQGGILNFKLDKVAITGSGAATNAGGLVGTIEAGSVVSYVTVDATIKDVATAGGIAAINYDVVEDCSTQGKIDTGNVNQARAGGLVGFDAHLGTATGTIGLDYSTVSVTVGKNSYGGGLVGYDNSSGIGSTYATGSVNGGKGSYVGGLIGYSNQVANADSYSTGAVTATAGGVAGGLIGQVGSGSQTMTDNYWDTTTTGISSASQGAGSPANEPGITGLTTTQLQSGLPAGFSPGTWGENPTINGGLPYLIALPPN